MGRYFCRAKNPVPAAFIARLYEGKKPGTPLLQRASPEDSPRGIHNRLLEELNHREPRCCHIPSNEHSSEISQSQQSCGPGGFLCLMWAVAKRNLSTCTDLLTLLTSLVEEVSEIAGYIISERNPP